MKKILLPVIVFIGLLSFAACDDSGGTKADLQFTNSTGTSGPVLSDIYWMSGGDKDQSWSGNFSNGSTTDSKGITALAGSVDAIEAVTGHSLTITLTASGSTGATVGSGSSAVVAENANATLVISGAAKK